MPRRTCAIIWSLITGKSSPSKPKRPTAGARGSSRQNTRACTAAALLSGSTSKCGRRSGVILGDLGLEGIFIKTVGSSVVLAGNNAAACTHLVFLGTT